MAKKYEFKPDKAPSSLLSRLDLTRKQRRSILKWVLYALVLLFLSVVQDVILSQVRIFGATTDLLCGALLMVCIMLDPEQGCIFILTGATLYHFSGVSPGPYTIAFLTVIGLIISIFRQAYLRRSFITTFLCTGVAIMVYELMVFAAGAFWGHTNITRLQVFLLSGLYTLLVTPALYPIFRVIGKIGGESWKE